MTTALSRLLAKSKELREAATPGPWKLCFHLQSEENDNKCSCGTPGNIWGSDGEHVVCSMGSHALDAPDAPPRYKRAKEISNAQFIVEASATLEAKDEMLALMAEALKCEFACEHIYEGSVGACNVCRTLAKVEEIARSLGGRLNGLFQGNY